MYSIRCWLVYKHYVVCCIHTCGAGGSNIISTPVCVCVCVKHIHCVFGNGEKFIFNNISMCVWVWESELHVYVTVVCAHTFQTCTRKQQKDPSNDRSASRSNSIINTPLNLWFFFLFHRLKHTSPMCFRTIILLPLEIVHFSPSLPSLSPTHSLSHFLLRTCACVCVSVYW